MTSWASCSRTPSSPRCSEPEVGPQARAGAGFDRTAFTIDWDKRQATCPRGDTSTWWSPATLRGT
ncbi:hypothetical protein, partial [Streptomyces sp. A1547]|uniref:hypothetical protein n=1 Tax=Streptomyces sp. A1547 TaxID=2563105 RepID=UPI0019CF6D7A